MKIKVVRQPKTTLNGKWDTLWSIISSIAIETMSELVTEYREATTIVQRLWHLVTVAKVINKRPKIAITVFDLT